MIGNIRENIVMGRFLDNHSLMINFDKNVKEVTALLATLPFAEMQKLPVQVRARFAVCFRPLLPSVFLSVTVISPISLAI